MFYERYLMYPHYNIKHSCVCKCGVFIFLEDNDKITCPWTGVKCPVCGFVIRLFTPEGE